MTRFENELNGKYGAFWQIEAQQKVFDAQFQYADGKLLITKDGVAFWAVNGRAVMEDYADILEHTWMAGFFSRENTKAFRDVQNDIAIMQYKNSHSSVSSETMEEMRNAFGSGTKVVDVLSGETYAL